MMNTIRVQFTPLRRVLLPVLVMLASLWLSVACRTSDLRLVHESVDQPLGTAARAEVEIAMSVGQLQIGALSQPDILLRGEIAYPDHSRVIRDFTMSDDTGTFKLREDDSRRTIRDTVDEAPVWNLRLNQATPLRLRLETGVGENSIDLSQLHVTDFDLHSGVGATTVILPRRGAMHAEVSGGIGSTTIVVPTGVPVRVESSVGLGNITVPSSYLQQGKAYVSPESDTAADRIELTVNGGIGGITIKESSE